MKRLLFLSLINILLLCSIISGCSRKEKKVSRLEKFNSELWIEDKNGCQGSRLELKDQLLSVKHNMRGLKTNEIEDYLGKPDAQELYNRSQRYYIYFLESGPKCDHPTESPQALFVRFSAVGIANEFTVRSL